MFVHSESIFWPSLGHELFRNALDVSILFPERISYWRKSSRARPQHEEHDEIRRFCGFSLGVPTLHLESSRSFLQSVESGWYFSVVRDRFNKSSLIPSSDHEFSFLITWWRSTWFVVGGSLSAQQIEERLYESSRAVNDGWRFTARTKLGKIVHKNEDFSQSVNSFDF